MATANAICDICATPGVKFSVRDKFGVHNLVFCPECDTGYEFVARNPISFRRFVDECMRRNVNPKTE